MKVDRERLARELIKDQLSFDHPIRELMIELDKRVVEMLSALKEVAGQYNRLEMKHQIAIHALKEIESKEDECFTAAAYEMKDHYFGWAALNIAVKTLREIE